MDFNRIALPSLALLLGVATSVYFVFWWWRHRYASRTCMLYWATALFLFYWFQVPAILIGFGKIVTVTDFNLFFTLTFPITFLALIFIYMGIVRIAEWRLNKKKKIFLAAWFSFAIFFFAYQFILNEGVISTYLLPLGGNALFYIPLRTLIAVTVVRILWGPLLKTPLGILALIGVLGESLLGLARNVFIIHRVLEYPPQFWYFVIADSQFFFVTQAIGIPLLAIGLTALHYIFHRRQNSKISY